MLRHADDDEIRDCTDFARVPRIELSLKKKLFGLVKFLLRRSASPSD